MRSSALADSAVPCPQSRRAPLACGADKEDNVFCRSDTQQAGSHRIIFRSRDQRLVGQALASNAVNEAAKPVQRVTGHVAVIEPERELIDVAADVFWAGVVVDADQAPLKHREHGLNAVRSHAIANIFAFAMVDGRMVEKQTTYVAVRASLIRVQRRADRNVLNNGVLNGLRIGAGKLDCLGAPALAALFHAEHCGLANCAATGFQLFVLVLVGLDPAHIGFVNLDQALQHRHVAAACFPEPMQDEPCGLLRDANFLGELHRRYSLARRHEQIHRVNPLVQGNVAPLKDCAGAHRKVLTALIAAVEAALSGRDPLAKSADGALGAFRPQTAFKVNPRRVLVRKHGEQLKRRNRRFCHDSKFPPDVKLQDCMWRKTKHHLKRPGYHLAGIHSRRIAFCPIGLKLLNRHQLQVCRHNLGDREANYRYVRRDGTG